MSLGRKQKDNHRQAKKMVSMDKAAMISQIDLSLNEVRPHLFIDGGNVEVVGITDEMLVQIKWMGNCQGCQMSTMTLKAGIEQTLKSRHPEISGVVAIN